MRKYFVSYESPLRKGWTTITRENPVCSADDIQGWVDYLEEQHPGEKFTILGWQKMELPE